MSIVLEYSSSKDASQNTDFGTRNGSVAMRQEFKLDPNKKKAYRIIKATISPVIPNIYNYNNVNTTLIKLSRDGGATWITCQLKAGYYNIRELSDAINNVCNQNNWWASVGNPGLTISYNPSTQFVYTSIDSTLLALGGTQFCIDYGASQFHQLLGYPSNACIFNTDGIHTAPNIPRIDFQGSSIYVSMSIIQGSRYVNGQLSNYICKIPLVNTSNNEIVFPSGETGLISPMVKCSIPYSIMGFDVHFMSSTGQEMIWSYGEVSLEVEIMDIE